MDRIVVLGCGRQAWGAVHSLSTQGFGPFLLADQDLARARQVGSLLDRHAPAPWEAVQASAEEAGSLMKGAKGILNCISYLHNPPVIRAAARAGVPYVDLGTEPDDIEALRSEPEVAHAAVPLVFDAGLAPGMVNEMAARMAAAKPWIDSIRLYCGGLPVTPTGPLAYYPFFSPESVLAEYEDPAEAIDEGRRTVVPSFTDLHHVAFPGWGRLEAFTTSGGASDGPRIHEGRLREYKYFTLRWKGHQKSMSLLRELGLWSSAPLPESGASPRAVLCELMSRSAGDPPEDVVLAAVIGKGQGKTSVKRVVFPARPELGLSAMSSATGGQAARVLVEILTLPTETGLISAARAAEKRALTR